MSDPDLRRAIAKGNYQQEVQVVASAWGRTHECGLELDLILNPEKSPTLLAHFGRAVALAGDLRPGSVETALRTRLPHDVHATYVHDRVKLSRRFAMNRDLEVTVSAGSEFVKRRGIRPLVMTLIDATQSPADSNLRAGGHDGV